MGPLFGQALGDVIEVPMGRCVVGTDGFIDGEELLMTYGKDLATIGKSEVSEVGSEVGLLLGSRAVTDV